MRMSKEVFYYQKLIYDKKNNTFQNRNETCVRSTLRTKKSRSKIKVKYIERNYEVNRTILKQ